MFCKNCGSQINDDALFCPVCGQNNNMNSSNEVHEKDDKVLYQIKPKFKFIYKLFEYLWNGIIDVFIILFLLGISPFMLGICLIFLIVYVIVRMVVNYFQYKNINYNFYRKKLEYVDGFINKEQKELKYKFIREVAMKRSILERIFGIGTIRIYTNASSDYGNRMRHGTMAGKNGIYIHCVENVEETYRKVKEYIDAAQED